MQRDALAALRDEQARAVRAEEQLATAQQRILELQAELNTMQRRFDERIRELEAAQVCASSVVSGNVRLNRWLWRECSRLQLHALATAQDERARVVRAEEQLAAAQQRIDGMQAEAAAMQQRFAEQSRVLEDTKVNALLASLASVYSCCIQLKICC